MLKALSKIKYITGDLNPLVSDREIDITDINFKDDYFDFIICNHVLEQVQEDRKAMNGLFRVLKHGGEAILQVPTSKYNKDTFEDFSIILPAVKVGMRAFSCFLKTKKEENILK